MNGLVIACRCDLCGRTVEPKSGGKGHERSVQFGSRRGCSSDRRSDSHRHWFGPIGRATGAASASVYAPIVPCRLVDTRPAPDNVGAKSIPLRAAEVVTFAVSGTNGNCTIPTSATGIATNATAVHPTADSCITIYTADAVPGPTASNLNVVAESPPTPNQVTVGLSSAGAFEWTRSFWCIWRGGVRCCGPGCRCWRVARLRR